MSVTPIAVGDTVALTGSGWASMIRPDQTGTMLGLEVEVVALTPGFGGAPSVKFEVDGQPFIAPTRPGSRYQAELLPTED